MTRWTMVADLRRCVGCQTCTAACKHVNATPPQVQYRRVLDVEAGTFPDVSRVFVPVGCQHCSEPPCVDVCPSTATRRRDDGIVTIDYGLCIGCAYCAVACPYQARYKVDKPRFAFGERPTANEYRRDMPERLGVAQKCTFCADRIDYGLENGLVPGIDPDATPACVNSCIADALHFGDIDDPESHVAQLLGSNKSFRMHEALETAPGFHYLWGSAPDDPDSASVARDNRHTASEQTGPGGVESWLQQHWDWRAASNFIAGGSGVGLYVSAAVASPDLRLPGLVALALVGWGLMMVWAEIGRPLRAMNVFFNPRTSWMARESIAAVCFIGLGLAGAWWRSPVFVYAAAGCGMVFLYCQAQMLPAAKGIPAWREAGIVPVFLSTGLAEGVGLCLILVNLLYPGRAADAAAWLTAALLILIVWRALSWQAYRQALSRGAPLKTLEVLSRIDPYVLLVGHSGPLVLILASAPIPVAAPALQSIAGSCVLATGWLIKFVIITRASFNQGFALPHAPARGPAAGSGSGIHPGWA